MNNLTLKKSRKFGRSVFSRKNFKTGSIVEVAPAIFVKSKSIRESSIVKDYLFASSNPNLDALTFGYGSMYNHSENPNIEWSVSLKKKNVTYKAIRPIKKGDELFVSYGDDYWTSRKMKMK